MTVLYNLMSIQNRVQWTSSHFEHFFRWYFRDRWYIVPHTVVWIMNTCRGSSSVSVTLIQSINRTHNDEITLIYMYYTHRIQNVSLKLHWGVSLVFMHIQEVLKWFNTFRMCIEVPCRETRMRETHHYIWLIIIITETT